MIQGDIRHSPAHAGGVLKNREPGCGQRKCWEIDAVHAKRRLEAGSDLSVGSGKPLRNLEIWARSLGISTAQYIEDGHVVVQEGELISHRQELFWHHGIEDFQHGEQGKFVRQ